MGGVKSPIPVLLQAVPDDTVESRRDVPPRLRQLRRILFQDRRDRVARRVPLERPLAREHLVEDRPEREDVRAVIDGQAAHLLGRHVAHRAHHRPRLRVARAGRRARLLLRRDGLRLLRQPEVEDLDDGRPSRRTGSPASGPGGRCLSRAPRRGLSRPGARNRWPASARSGPCRACPAASRLPEAPSPHRPSRSAFRSRGSRGCSDATAPRPPWLRARTAPARSDPSPPSPEAP